MTFLS